MLYPTPHGDKLRALIANDKLPKKTRPTVHASIKRYEEWITEINQIADVSGQLVESLVRSLNRYKMYVDLDLIFDSPDDFLYRQKGQLKLDNSVLEEFLPLLVRRFFSTRLDDLDVTIGPTNAFSHLRFDSNLIGATDGGGVAVRSKDHDFAIARPLFLRASHHEDFNESYEAKTHLAYVAAEIKTNLDKTMFQEASATAQDLKLAIPNSRYYLLCEWLDMTPISSAVTAIEEVIVLRRARRLSADVRRHFSTAVGRIENRTTYARYLNEHPFAPEAFRRLLDHFERLLGDESPNNQDILNRGWF